MNCLFCKKPSNTSKSVEHIIPESLGNKEHILAKGLVCDSCNQYFARKVEKPLLEQPYFKNVRHRAAIESKKGRVPSETAMVISPALGKAEITLEKNGNISVTYDDKELVEKVMAGSKGAFIVPILISPEENNKILSRFLAKVAVEALLYRLIDEEGWIEEIMTNPDLEAIKRYARYGEGVNFWPYHQRRIYSENTRFHHPEIPDRYEVLHEFHIFSTKEDHYYFVMVIMGIEYAICYGGPGIDSYLEWLNENNHKSVLDDPLEEKVSIDPSSS